MSHLRLTHSTWSQSSGGVHVWGQPGVSTSHRVVSPFSLIPSPARTLHLDLIIQFLQNSTIIKKTFFCRLTAIPWDLFEPIQTRTGRPGGVSGRAPHTLSLLASPGHLWISGTAGSRDLVTLGSSTNHD